MLINELHEFKIIIMPQLLVSCLIAHKNNSKMFNTECTQVLHNYIFRIRCY